MAVELLCLQLCYFGRGNSFEQNFGGHGGVVLHGNVDLLTEVKVWNSCWVLLVKGFDGEHGKMVRARSTFLPFPLDLQDMVYFSSHTTSLTICHENRKHFDAQFWFTLTLNKLNGTRIVFMPPSSVAVWKAVRRPVNRTFAWKLFFSYQLPCKLQSK